MQKDKILSLAEVAVKLGVSVFTINNWYAFKRLQPDHPMAKLLPEYIQENPRSARKWKAEDLKYLRQFKRQVVVGRSGFLGCATQRYKKETKCKKKDLIS